MYFIELRLECVHLEGSLIIQVLLEHKWDNSNLIYDIFILGATIASSIYTEYVDYAEIRIATVYRAFEQLYNYISE